MSTSTGLTQPDPSSSRWLHGAAVDLLFGCGVAYFGIFLLLTAMGVQLQQWIPLSVLPLVLLVTSTPHYGATLMRVFNQRESRVKYATIGVGSTLLMMVAFVVSLEYHPLGSLLLTIYFDWNPWHYAGQNYGLALMFLHRRGVVVEPTTKRLLWASFLLSFVLAFLTNNGEQPGALFASDYADSGSTEIGPAFQFMSIGLPKPVQEGAFLVALSIYLLCLLLAFVRLLRVGSLRDLIPSALLVFTQSLWFVIPATAQMEGLFGGVMPLAQENRQYVFMWIIVGHATQYLWVSSYYAKRTPGYGGGPRYFAMCVLAGAVVWNLPPLIFAPEFFGTLAYNDGLQLLVATVVNLHHFILDGAIWKLRDGRVASILLRRTKSSDAATGPPARSWMRPLVVVLGVVSVSAMLVGLAERELGVRKAAARGDIARVERAAERLAWVGQGEAWIHRFLGQQRLKSGDLEGAREYFESSLELKNHPRAWFDLGDTHSRRKEWDKAAEAYAEAYAFDDTKPRLILGYAHALAESGQTERAKGVLEAGLVHFPNSDVMRRALRQLEERSPR